MGIEEIDYKGHHIEIENDEDPQNPRTEWDNYTVIHCCSSRHYLGEKNHANWEEFHAAVREARKRGDMVFDVYAYIHGGVALSLGDFYGKVPQGHAQFDSGKCGCIVVKKKDIIENWGKKNWTEALKKKAYEVAESDIETFNSYLNGEVYGYLIDEGTEDGDSCFGFYSVEEAMGEAKSVVDFVVKRDIKSHLEQLKLWIKNKVPLIYRRTLTMALT